MLLLTTLLLLYSPGDDRGDLLLGFRLEMVSKLLYLIGLNVLELLSLLQDEPEVTEDLVLWSLKDLRGNLVKRRTI